VVPGSRFQVPGSRFQVPNFKFKVYKIARQKDIKTIL